MDVAFLRSNVQPLALKWQVAEGDPKQSTRNTIIKLKESSCVLIGTHRGAHFLKCNLGRTSRSLTQGQCISELDEFTSQCMPKFSTAG